MLVRHFLCLLVSSVVKCVGLFSLGLCFFSCLLCRGRPLLAGFCRGAGGRGRFFLGGYGRVFRGAVGRSCKGCLGLIVPGSRRADVLLLFRGWRRGWVLRGRGACGCRGGASGALVCTESPVRCCGVRARCAPFRAALLSLRLGEGCFFSRAAMRVPGLSGRLRRVRSVAARGVYLVSRLLSGKLGPGKLVIFFFWRSVGISRAVYSFFWCIWRVIRGAQS